jgi:PI-3-kinase-related kinase SMG-1
MLEEYCNAHETARAARTAVSLMQRQLNDLTEALRKIVLEIVQVEWLHDLSSPHAQKAKIFSQNILSDDKFMSMLLNLSRRNLLDKIQSSVSLMTRSIECLQACERTSCSAEGQLERAMGWACAGPNTSGAGGSTAKGSGIPPEFHDHLLKRRKLLGGVQEQASDIVKSCTAVLEFEASRDGLYFVSEDKSSGQSTDKGRAWQQTFLNLLTRLDAAYHSFTCKLITFLLYFCYIYICARILFSAQGASNILWVIFVEGSETCSWPVKSEFPCHIFVLMSMLYHKKQPYML